MRANQTDKRLLIGSMISFTGIALSIFLMALPRMFQDSDIAILKYYPGTLFWFFTVLSVALQTVLTIRYRSQRQKHRMRHVRTRARVGLLAFPQSVMGLAVCGVCGIALLTLIGMLICNASPSAQLIAISIVILTLCLHAVLDGKVWNEVMVKETRIRKESTKNHSETEENGL